MKREKLKIKVFFVSDDGNEEAFLRNLKGMSWFALPFQDQDRKMSLKENFGINGIPNLTVIHASTGDLIKQDACSDV